jgi:ubiquinone/menaquinone biosynthesis C-methylase UbiE/uncharacterized protein YbaR (Trm112 family)
LHFFHFLFNPETCYFGIMIRNALLHLRCPACRGPFRLKQGRSIDREISSGELICRSCGYHGFIKARLPVLLPPGQEAVWKTPFERAGGRHWYRWVKKHGFEALASRLMEPKARTGDSGQTLPPYYFRRALYEGSERFFDEVIKPAEDDLPGMAEQAGMIIRRIVECAPRRILEICSRRGQFLEKLIPWRPQAGFIAPVDLDFKNMKILERRVRRLEQPQSIIPAVCDVHSLPFPDLYFDAALSFKGLSEVESVDLVLREIRRVLKPSGLFWAFESLQGTDLKSRNMLESLLMHGIREHLGVHHGAHDLVIRCRKAGFRHVTMTSFEQKNHSYLLLECAVS